MVHEALEVRAVTGLDELWLESAYAPVPHDRVLGLLRSGRVVYAMCVTGAQRRWFRVGSGNGTGARELVWDGGPLRGAPVAYWPPRRWRCMS